MSDLSTICHKCKTSKSVIKLQSSLNCIDCFYDTMSHKFRISIRGSLNIKPSETMLLAYSGGASSNALYTLVKTTHIEKQPRCSVLYNFEVIHIDDSFLFQNSISVEESEGRINDMKLYFKEQNTIFHCVSLTNVYENDEEENILRNRLIALTSSMTQNKAEEFRWQLKLRILEKFSKLNNFTRIAVGTSSTRLAETVLTSTLEGRGLNVPLLTAEQWSFSTVPIIRPLRTILRASLCYFSYMKKSPVIFCPSFNGKSTTKVTINFIANLQSITPNTVSSIVRTAEKLILPQKYNNLVALPENLHHTRLNQVASYQGDDKNIVLCQLCSQIITAEKGDLCKPCQSLLKFDGLNPENVADYPNFLKKAIIREKQRQQIAEFLL